MDYVLADMCASAFSAALAIPVALLIFDSKRPRPALCWYFAVCLGLLSGCLGIMSISLTSITTWLSALLWWVVSIRSVKNVP